jgi:hypothetical protein
MSRSFLCRCLVLAEVGEADRESVHEGGNDKNFGLFLVLVVGEGMPPVVLDMAEGRSLSHCK